MKFISTCMLCLISAAILALGGCSGEKKKDTGWEVVGEENFAGGSIGVPDIAFDSKDTPYVAYVDGANKNGCSVRKFDGTSWTIVGVTNFTNTPVGQTCIAIDSSDVIYVTYNGQYSELAFVRKFSGSEWISLDGSAKGAINSDSAIDTSIALSTTGVSYVAYSNFDGVVGQANVMKFENSAWSMVGLSKFSDGQANGLRIAIAPDGTPYVVYKDYAYGDKATVMKFDGTTWAPVGNPGFSADMAPFPDIAIDSNGVPYVVYLDWGYNGFGTVKKFDGSEWVTVGSPGFTSGEAVAPCIAFDSLNTPYIAYDDFTHNDGACVMRYNGTSWESVGLTEFSSSSAGNLSLAFNSKDIPYVVFQSGDVGTATVMRLKQQ